MRPILVTGGAGRLARRLKACGGERVTAPSRDILDVSDAVALAAALDAIEPSLVINAAAVSRLEDAAADPARSFAVNALAPGVMAQACAARGVPIIHVSTDYVFGAPTSRPWREQDPVSPVNAYGEAKAEGERRVLAVAGVRCVVRVAWLFGDESDFLTQMMSQGRAEGRVVVAEDQVGSPTPLTPLAGLLIRLGERLVRGDDMPPILHMAGSPPVSRADWVQAAFDGLAAAGGSAPQLVRAPMSSFAARIVRPRFSALDTSLLQSVFDADLAWEAEARAVGRAYAKGA